MSKSRKSLKKPRTSAFHSQHGYCYYCKQPMWISNPRHFASRFGITLPQARLLQCTGEHLLSHQDGGSSARHNIVAACWFCNHRRHYRRKNTPNPKQYKEIVKRRINKGGWHGIKLVSKSPAV